MVGIPVVTEYGITVKSLMLPAIRPNAIIQVESLTRDATDEKALLTETEAGAGRYRVNAARYQGSNFGNDYYVTADCQAVKDGEVVRPDHKGHAADEIGESRYPVCYDDLGISTKINIHNDDIFATVERIYVNSTGAEMSASIVVKSNGLNSTSIKSLFDRVANDFFMRNDGVDISSYAKPVTIFCSSPENEQKASIASQVVGRIIFESNLNDWKNAWQRVGQIEVRPNFENACGAYREDKENAHPSADYSAVYMYDGAFVSPVSSVWGHRSIHKVLAHEVAHFIYKQAWGDLGTVRAKYSEERLHFLVAFAAKVLISSLGVSCASLLGNDCSPPITLEERRMAEKGDLQGFWDSRYVLGDAWSLSGRGIWSKNANEVQKKIGNRSLGYLLGWIKFTKTLNLLSCPEDEVLETIGKRLVEEHIIAIDQFGGKGPLSYETVAEYHHIVFAECGIPPHAYGGTPAGPLVLGGVRSYAIGPYGARITFPTFTKSNDFEKIQGISLNALFGFREKCNSKDN